MKISIPWLPLVLMALVAGLSVWGLVRVQASRHGDARVEVGSRSVALRVGDSLGVIEIAPPGLPQTGQAPVGQAPVGRARVGQARVLMRDGHASAWFDREQFAERFGQAAAVAVFDTSGNRWQRLLNAPWRGGWAWVVLGLFAQAVFAARMVVQWVVSEGKQESVVPPIYWWLSLAGGLMLLAYFIWRADLVGVLGQSAGVVIYARNLQLLAKKRPARAQESPAEVG